MMYNVTISVNFPDKATRDALFEDVRKAQGSMVKGASSFSRHVCYHDEIPLKPCTEEESVIVGPESIAL